MRKLLVCYQKAPHNMKYKEEITATKREQENTISWQE